MCKEDIRIGRNTASKRVVGVSAAGGGTKIAGADAGRIAITFAYNSAPDTVNQPFISLCWLSGDGLVPLAGVTMEHPVKTVTIGEQGIGVTGELYAVAWGVGTPNFAADLVRLNVALEDI